jgi:hypothetical protein
VPLLAGEIAYLPIVADRPFVVLILALPTVKSRMPPLKTIWEFDGIKTVDPGEEIVTTPPFAVCTLSP